MPACPCTKCFGPFTRYSNREETGISDAQRGVISVRGAVGKRLTYAGLTEAPRTKAAGKKPRNQRRMTTS
jgi:hypothetical protein